MALSDINECTVSNGGCSHKCVNIAGGYKCECPDPELNLALDNKTCHGKYWRILQLSRKIQKEGKIFRVKTFQVHFIR